jgi:hypothetical protein
VRITVETATIRALEKRFRAAGKNTKPALARAVKRAGDMALTAMTRSLTRQTGLKRKTIVKALKKEGGRGSLSYAIRSAGGDVSLKYFGARETRAGVSAKPFGARMVVKRVFMKGGRFPKRVPLNLGGHVFRREAGSRFPIAKVKSGVVIPAQMVTGATKSAFEKTASTQFLKRIQHELERLL